MIFFPTTDEDVQHFRGKGYTGSINDMHYKALGDLNHTGALSDRINSFLVSEYGSFYETMRDLRNTTASFVALRYGVGAIQPEFVLDFGEEYYRVDGLKTALSDTVTHSRASNATMTDSTGTLVTVGNNVPRTGHHIYDGYEWVNEGILHESEARTNLIPDMHGLSSAADRLSKVSTTSPDGSNSAEEYRIASGTGAAYIYDTVPISSGTTYTHSMFVKLPTGTPSVGLRYVSLTTQTSFPDNEVIFDLQEGVVVGTPSMPDNSITPYGNGWYRISATNTADVSGTGFSFILWPVSDSAGTDLLIENYTVGDKVFDIYGPQIEAGSTPSSYIPTAGATVTRAAETLTVAAANMPDYMTPTVIGGELITNGTFDTDVTGWAVLFGSVSWESGLLRLTEDGGDASTARSYQGITTEIGKTYIITADVGTVSLGNAQIVASTSTDTGGFPVVSSSGSETVELVFVAAATTTNVLLGVSGSSARTADFDNISVKEINPLSVSIQMQGKMTYADTDDFNEVVIMRWRNASETDQLTAYIATDSTNTGRFTVASEAANTPRYSLLSSPQYPAGLNVPFNFALATTSTTLRSGTDLGTSSTVSTTGVPELSAEDFEVGQDFNGTIKSLRVWDKDISDTGIATASAPTFTDEFAMTVTTTTANETFTIPCQNVGTFNAGIQWGDGSVSTVTAYNDANLTHTFATAGDHLIRIRGSFPNIYFNNAGDKLKVKSVHNLGIVGWTKLNNAFHGCSNMTSFTAGTTDTSAVTAMYTMFYSCTGLTALDLSNFNTAAVKAMGSMFRACSSLTALDLSNFNTTAVTDMGAMFYDCSSLTALDLSNFNTTAVVNTSYMFQNCSSLTSLDVSNFNTTAVTTMSQMFRDCSSLTALDVSSFNTTAVTNMSNMFFGCSSLTSLDVSSFNTAAVANMSHMFRGCSSLTALDVSNFNTAAVTSMNDMFYGCNSLTALDVSSFNTASVTNMYSMFNACSSLTSLDVSSFNTTAATNMGAMFYGCSSLTALDVSSFNTAAVVSMAYMFYNCSSLTALDVSSFNTTAVTNMGAMFYNCTGLTSLDVSSFNTAAVKAMGSMFRNCSSLTALDLSNFNTTAVTGMYAMFRDCSSLTSLDVSSFNTTAATNMGAMFRNCTGLTSLDVSSFNTAAVTTMDNMFRDCSSTTDIIGVDGFNIEGLNSVGDLSNFMNNVTLPTARYDALLINWDAQEAFDAMTPNFGLSTYTGGGTAAAARANLISNDLWAITDGGIA